MAATSVGDTIVSQGLTLAKVKNAIGLEGARAVIVLAITELVGFFNVSNTMSAEQIALTTDLILESYWYFKIEDIKCCFRRAMRSGQLYGRLDGNVIFGWLREYDLERDQAIEEGEIAANNAHKSDLVQEERAGDAISLDEFLEQMKIKSLSGDKVAQETLEAAGKMKVAPKAWSEDKEKAFKEYYKQYRINKAKHND